MSHAASQQSRFSSSHINRSLCSLFPKIAFSNWGRQLTKRLFPLFIPFFLAVRLKEPVTAMTLEEAIKVIQVAERARQGRARAAFMRRIYFEEKRQSRKREKKRGKNPDLAATCIQKVSFLCSNSSGKAKCQCFGQESSCRGKHRSQDGKLSEMVLFRVSSKVKYII